MSLQLGDAAGTAIVVTIAVKFELCSEPVLFHLSASLALYK
jgi:hypothetical protein